MPFDFCPPPGRNWLKVVESKEHPEGAYHASNVLHESCDDSTWTSFSHFKVGNISWWLAPDRQKGDGAYFVVQMGAERIVDKVTLKNSRNGRATRLAFEV